MFLRIAVLLVALSGIGCKSFKTTIMQRSSDSRFYPNQPCSLTQGLPVKLKVPTHVEVRITENFIVQNVTGANASANVAKAAQVQAKAIKAQEAATAALSAANQEVADANTADQNAATAVANNPNNRDLIEAKRLTAIRLVQANASLVTANADAVQADGDFDTAKRLLKAAQDDLAATDPIYRETKILANGRRIRSLQVETSLHYTDKVFTVDFRRPAGGVLDLTTASMDNEQYFAKVAADYQEQTIQQINSAIGTLATGNPSAPTATDAVITQAGTSPKVVIASDKRVVAMSRFDISEPDWEERLHHFVATHVTQCSDGCPAGLAAN